MLGTRGASRFAAVAVAVVAWLGVARPAPVLAAATELVSVASNGAQGDGFSWIGYRSTQALSANGRYVAFTSKAANLVPGDNNRKADVFVRDRRTGSTERVSVGSRGAQANRQSGLFVAISATGRYVAFTSAAANITKGDSNRASDVFVHDRHTGATERVSVAGDGSQGNGRSFGAAISADGRYVAFWSEASNLVAGDTNGAEDVFLHDRLTGATRRVDVASDGSQADAGGLGASITPDGRYVAFWSEATNLASTDSPGEDVFVHDDVTGHTDRVSVRSDGRSAKFGGIYPSISADGRFVAFESDAPDLVPGDTNGTNDVFVHDRQTGVTERVSVASDGTQGNGAGYSYAASISADGRFVTFGSYASNLAPGDTNGTEDIFRHDRLTGETDLVSAAADGGPANGRSGDASSMSADGRYVVFSSSASNLVAGDENGLPDVFLRDMGAVSPAGGS